MGEVIQFRPTTRYGKQIDAQARIEKELMLPFTTAETSGRRPSRANVPDFPPCAASKKNLPVNGIAIVIGSILVYALVISHVVGQPHYSARANLMPAAFVQN